MSDYYDWDKFSEVYLEDSYVLKIEESQNSISFEMDIVLTERHPCYVQPSPEEAYCYKTGVIVFDDVRSVEWIRRSFQAYTDATGSKDLGNIDSLELNNGKYSISGDWGELRLISSPPKLVWSSSGRQGKSSTDPVDEENSSGLI